MKQDFTSLEDITRVSQRLNARNGQLPFSLVLMTDQLLLPQAIEAVVALPASITAELAIIFRDYNAPARATLGQEWRDVTAARNIPLLVAGDAGLAEQLKAEGLHIPQWLHAQAQGLRTRFPDGLLTASCHTETERGLLDGVGLTALIISPVFTTRSHKGEKELGLAELAKFTTACTTPAIGLGGIDQYTYQKLENSGLSGLAGISLFKL